MADSASRKHFASAPASAGAQEPPTPRLGASPFEGNIKIRSRPVIPPQPPSSIPLPPRGDSGDDAAATGGKPPTAGAAKVADGPSDLRLGLEWLETGDLLEDALDFFSPEEIMRGEVLSGALGVRRALRRFDPSSFSGGGGGAEDEEDESVLRRVDPDSDESTLPTSGPAVGARARVVHAWKTASFETRTACVHHWLDALESASPAARTAASSALLYVAVGLPVGDRFKFSEPAMRESAALLQAGGVEQAALHHFLACYQRTNFATSGRLALRMSMGLLYMVMTGGQEDPDFCDRFGGVVEDGELSLLVKLLDAVMVCTVYSVLPVKKVLCMLRTSLRVVFGSLQTLTMAKLLRRSEAEQAATDASAGGTPIPEMERAASLHSSPDSPAQVDEDGVGHMVDVLVAKGEALPSTPAASRLYRLIQPTMFQRVVCFITMLLAAAPTREYKGKLQLYAEIEIPGLELPKPAADASRARHRDIVSSAVTEILLLLMKHWRRSHPLQADYFTLLLSTAGPELFTLYVNHDMLLFMTTTDPFVDATLTPSGLAEAVEAAAGIKRPAVGVRDVSEDVVAEVVEAPSPPLDAISGTVATASTVDLMIWSFLGGKLMPRPPGTSSETGAAGDEQMLEGGSRSLLGDSGSLPKWKGSSDDSALPDRPRTLLHGTPPRSPTGRPLRVEGGSPKRGRLRPTRSAEGPKRSRRRLSEDGADSSSAAAAPASDAEVGAAKTPTARRLVLDAADLDATLSLSSEEDSGAATPSSQSNGSLALADATAAVSGITPAPQVSNATGLVRGKRPPPLQLSFAGEGPSLGVTSPFGGNTSSPSLSPMPAVARPNASAALDTSGLNRRRVATGVAVLRILQRITKRRPERIKKILVSLKTATVLRRTRTLTAVPPLALYALKLLKSQVRYLGVGWRRKNMKVISEIYRHIRLERGDRWLVPPMGSSSTRDPTSNRNGGGGIARNAGIRPQSEKRLQARIKAYHKALAELAEPGKSAGGEPTSDAASADATASTAAGEAPAQAAAPAAADPASFAKALDDADPGGASEEKAGEGGGADADPREQKQSRRRKSTRRGSSPSGAGKSSGGSRRYKLRKDDSWRRRDPSPADASASRKPGGDSSPPLQDDDGDEPVRAVDALVGGGNLISECEDPMLSGLAKITLTEEETATYTQYLDLYVPLDGESWSAPVS